ncbi:hypothetical protein [Streptomyces sp. JV184]|uniref:hypothetical protein n=1 Tax=Streptomyces sp. JV184 TaxID=858637 RepID=UPI002E78E967|nr:hypothetical protein [Streptomyces sp. JV184]MEE1743410.1 hypothetical protein [Streptomyces sp. JV184]
MRRLVFDEESRFSSFIGAYLGVLTLPNFSGLDGELLIHVGVGRTAGMYGARHLGDARAQFLFRNERELDYHHRDVPRRKELLRGAFAGMHTQVDRWLDELDRTPAFYFDSITQLRKDTWSQAGWRSSARGLLPRSGRRRRVRPRWRAGTSGRRPRACLPRPRARDGGARARQPRGRAERGEDPDPHIPPRCVGTGAGRTPDLLPACGPQPCLFVRLTTRRARLYNPVAVDD